MNNQFNFNRFQLLVKRQWLENKKLFLMGIGVLFGLGILFYSITTSWRGANLDFSIQASTLIIGLFLGGSIFANFIFKDFSEKSNSGKFLMLPASHFEKLMAGVFYSLIVFPVIFLAVFFIIDFSFVQYINNKHLVLLENNKEAIKNWRENIPFLNQILEKPIRDKQILIGFWLVSQTFTILGSIIFGRWSIIKTAVTGFIIFFIYIFINLFFNKLLISHLFETIVENNLGNAMEITKPINEIIMKVMAIFTLFILPTILFITSYFKLKEKQV